MESQVSEYYWHASDSMKESAVNENEVKPPADDEWDLIHHRICYFTKDGSSLRLV